MSILKPCPFCGGNASMHCDDPDYRDKLYFVMCDDCSCSTDYLPEEAAAETWNRRATTYSSEFAPHLAVHAFIEKATELLNELSNDMMNIAAESMSTEDYVKLARGIYDGEWAEESDETSSEDDMYYESGTDDGMVAREKMYMDFDVLSLTFSKKGKDTIIPVASSPINAVSPLETPSLTLWDRTFGGKGSTEDKLLFYIVLAVVVIVLLQLLAFAFPALQPILNVIYKILLLPFKLIVQLISWISEKIRSSRR